MKKKEEVVEAMLALAARLSITMELRVKNGNSAWNGLPKIPRTKRSFLPQWKPFDQECHLVEDTVLELYRIMT